MPAITYLLDDFIYQSTLDALYNVPSAWLHHLSRLRGKNPRRKRGHVWLSGALWARPEVEGYILANQPSFTAQLHGRMARFNDERGTQYWQASDRAANIQIELAGALRAPPATLAALRQDLREHRAQHSRLTPMPLEWTPNLNDLFTFFRYQYTNYRLHLDTFYGVPGAGEIFLTLRLRRDQLIMDAMTKLMDLEYQEKACLEQSRKEGIAL